MIDALPAPGFYTLERVAGPELGFASLVRFLVRSTGVSAVTVCQAEVERVFYTSQASGAITFADLTVAAPAFVEVTLDQGRRLHPQ